MRDSQKMKIGNEKVDENGKENKNGGEMAWKQWTSRRDGKITEEGNR